MRRPEGAAYRVGALIRHNLVLVGRDPGQFIAYLVMPMVLMAVEAPLYRSALRGQGLDAGTVRVVAGMLVMFSLLSLNIIGNQILAERTWRTWDRLRATAASPAELLAGRATPALLVLVVQQAALIGFGVLALGLRPADPALLAVVVLAWAVAVLGIGAALAALVRSHGQLGAACDIGALVLSGLGGALAPSETMPSWARAIAPLSPGYWAMQALRGALTGRPGVALPAVAVLAGLGAVTGAVACVRIGRGWGRAVPA